MIPEWKPHTEYSSGDLVTDVDGKVLECWLSGISSNTKPSGVANGVDRFLGDGTAMWSGTASVNRQPESKAPKCECGAGAVGSAIHSTWCDLA